MFVNSADGETFKLAFKLDLRECAQVSRCFCGVVSVHFSLTHRVLVLSLVRQCSLGSCLWFVKSEGKKQIGRWWHHCDTEFLKVVGSSWADPSELEPLKLKKYQSCPADPLDWHVILSFLTNDVKPFLFSSGGGEIACCPVTDKVEEDKQRWTTLHGNSANYQTDGWIIFGKLFW